MLYKDKRYNILDKAYLKAENKPSLEIVNPFTED